MHDLSAAKQDIVTAQILQGPGMVTISAGCLQAHVQHAMCYNDMPTSHLSHNGKALFSRFQQRRTSVFLVP